MIWLAEVFTPTTLSGLLSGARELAVRQPGLQTDDDDLAGWITLSRRRGGGAWRQLATVYPPNSQPFFVDEVTDQIPAGIAYIQLSLHALTSTVTVLTAGFGLDDDRARGLEDVLNQEFITRAKMLPDGGHTILNVERQKAAAVEEWRTSLRQEAADWLAERFPGTFHRLAPGQLPAMELLLTGRHHPWDPAGTTGTPGWARMLGLGGSHGYWQCTSSRCLRLQVRDDEGLRPGPRPLLMFAGLEQELVAHYAGSTGDSRSLLEVIISLEEAATALLARWSLSALIRELEEQLAGIQDFADQADRKRSPRALAETQRQLLHTGIDSRIVVNDIARYAQDPWWKHGILDFSEALPPALQGKAEPTASLAESLRQGQITDGQRVSRLETDLREILNTNAELTSTSENLRLQRRISRLTVVAVIATIVGAAAAVIALVIAARSPAGPGSRPSTHATNASTQAPTHVRVRSGALSVTSRPSPRKAFRDQIQ